MVDEVGRLFLAVWPPLSVVEGLAVAAATLPADRLRLVPPAQWHVTLAFLGMAPLAAASAGLAGLRVERATAEVGPQGISLGRGALCLPVAGLDALAAAARQAVGPALAGPDRRPFAGHLTVARWRRSAVRTALMPESGLQFAAAFEVTKVDLVRSQLGPDGPRYETVASVSLAG